MGYVKRKEDIHVRVEARAAGDFGIFTIGGRSKPEDAAVMDCEEIASQIRRHVDGLPSYQGRGVSVEWTNALYCEHCGAIWSEAENSPHNGGCCAKDCEVFEAAHPSQA